MEKIDFTKPQCVVHSLDGEAVIRGIVLQGVMVGKSSTYLNLTHENPLGRKERIPVSPSQARELARLLNAFVDQHEESL